MTVTTIGDDVDGVVALLATFTQAKKDSTALLASYVSLYNASAPRSQLTMALNAYVLKFNEVTTASNDLRAALAALQPKAAAVVVGLQNLTDDQVEEMKTNPVQYFSAGYISLVNSLLFYPKDVALEVIDMVHSDLIKDVTDAWNDQETGITPDPPRMSVFFASDHALTIVEKALKDVELDNEQPA